MEGITPEARPRLRPYVRVQWDPVRERQVLLAPEGVLVLNQTAGAILALCDGRRSVAAIAAELGAQYQRDVEPDVRAFLARLAGKRMLEFAVEEAADE